MSDFSIIFELQYSAMRYPSNSRTVACHDNTRCTLTVQLNIGLANVASSCGSTFFQNLALCSSAKRWTRKNADFRSEISLQYDILNYVSNSSRETCCHRSCSAYTVQLKYKAEIFFDLTWLHRLSRKSCFIFCTRHRRVWNLLLPT